MTRTERPCGDQWCNGRCVACRVVRAEQRRIDRIGMMMLAAAIFVGAMLVWLAA